MVAVEEHPAPHGQVGLAHAGAEREQRGDRRPAGDYWPSPAVSSTSASSRKSGITSSAKSCIISRVASWLPPFMPEHTMPALSSSEKTLSLSRTVAGLPYTR